MGGNAGQIRAGKAYVEAGWDDSALVAGLKSASGKLKAWGAGIQNVGLAVSGMAAAVTAPLAALAYKAGESGAELYRASQRTGVAVEALSELKYAAQQTGTDLEGLENGLRKMSKFVVGAAEGTDTAVQALDHLGLTVDQLNGMKPEERFALIGDRLSKIADPTIRAATAMEVFGKSGTSLLPMLEGGSAGLEKWRQRAQDLGLTTSGESATAAVLFKQALTDLQLVLAKLGNTIGQAVIPILKRKIEFVTGLITRAISWAKANRELVATIFKVASIVGIAGAALIAIGVTMSALAPIVTALAAAISFLASPAGLATAAIVVVGAALAALGAWFLYATEAGQAATSYLSGAFKTLADDVGTAVGGITDAIKAGDWVLAAEIAWTTLKIVWQRGVNELAKVWNAFGPATLKFFSDTWTGVLALTELVWDSLRRGWVSALEFVSQAWATVIYGIKRAWIEAREFISGTGATAIAGMSAFTGGSKAEADLKVGEAAHQQRVADEKAAISKEADDAIKAAGEKANAERETEAKRHQDRMAQIAGEGQARGQAALHGTALDEKALDDKLKALTEQQRQQAKQAVQEAAAAKKPEAVGIPKLPNADDLAAGLDDLGKRSSVAIGTFSAAAASRISRGDPMSARIAKATEMTSKAVQKVADLVSKVASFS